MTFRKTKYITLDQKYIGFILLVKCLIICFSSSSSSWYPLKNKLSRHHPHLTNPPQLLGLIEVFHHQYSTPHAMMNFQYFGVEVEDAHGHPLLQQQKNSSDIVIHCSQGNLINTDLITMFYTWISRCSRNISWWSHCCLCSY